MFIFNFYPLNFSFRQNRLQRLQSWGPDASLDTHIGGLDELWPLWQLWPLRHNGHIRDRGAIDVQYGCPKKRLNLRIAASEAHFAYMNPSSRVRSCPPARNWTHSPCCPPQWRCSGHIPACTAPPAPCISCPAAPCAGCPGKAFSTDSKIRHNIITLCSHNPTIPSPTHSLFLHFLSQYLPQDLLHHPHPLTAPSQYSFWSHSLLHYCIPNCLSLSPHSPLPVPIPLVVSCCILPTLLHHPYILTAPSH